MHPCSLLDFRQSFTASWRPIQIGPDVRASDGDVRAWPRLQRHLHFPGQQEGDVMNPNQALWEKGDFTRIAATHAGERRGAGRRDSASPRD